MTIQQRPVSTTGFSVRTVSLGGSSLSKAVQAGATEVSEWVEAAPTSVSKWLQRVNEVRDEFVSRDWLSPIEAAFSATGEAEARLKRAAANGVVVTTGQQPGLFGGPMYTLSKAISALAFADELQESTTVPVAAVFWAATDDSDWLEAATTSIVGRHGVEQLKLAGDPTNGVALADVPLGDTSDLFNELARASGSAAYARVLEQVRDAYVPHATIGSAYVQLMRALLEPLGIAVLDSSHPSLRRTADPFLRNALSNVAATASELAVNSKSIRDAGFAPQVDVIDTLSIVFRTSIDNSGVARRERIPASDASRAVREAEVGTLGANVLLRPVLERHLLPTVAYHAGPGELAYFAQVSSVARSLEAAVPVGVPRWAGEVVTDEPIQALERLNITEVELVTPHLAERIIAKAALNTEVSDSLERLRLAIETQIGILGESIAVDDLLLPSVVSGVERDIEHRVQRLERRLLAAARKRETVATTDLAVARAYLRPFGKSPERVLNAVPFLARYGKGVIDAMYREAKAHAKALLKR